jgi:P27 family predicted phage terminase small subunit
VNGEHDAAVSADRRAGNSGGFADRLNQLDRGILAVYCNAYAAWLEAVTALQTWGTMMKSPNGYPIQSPYVSIASKNAEIMIRIGAEFGFTPASRMRLPNQWKDHLLLELKSLEEIASELKPLEEPLRS